MRRTVAAAALAAFAAAPFLHSAPAIACAPPAEGEPHCDCMRYIFETDVAGQHVGVPDPTWRPQICD